MKIYQKILIPLFVIMVALLSIKGYKDSKRLGEINSIISLKESRSLANFMEAFRNTYQELFSELSIDYTEANILLHPVITIKEISNKFTIGSGLKRHIRVVSDNPINSKNMANEKELRAIKYFKEDVTRADYFEILEDSSYFYAKPILVDGICLKCHNTKETRPEFLKDNDRGLGYKVGDIRGIISISGDNVEMTERLEGEYSLTMLIYTLFVILLFLTVYIYFKKVYRQEEDYKEKLENAINEKTKELEKKNEEISFHLYYDTMTNLSNRNTLLYTLSNDDINTLILINIDDFKEINDFFGSNTGDEVLVSFAGFIELFAKDNDYWAYKLHADEYALVSKKSSEDEVRKDVISFLESSKQFVVITDEDNDIDISATAGIAYEQNSMLSCADMALKKAKKDKEPFLLYNKEMAIKEKYQNNLEWTRKLKRAIKDQKIVPYFQPIEHLASKKIVRYEALARMIDEHENVYTPYSFLEVSKKTKLYHNITYMILDQALKKFEEEDTEVSINISILDIMQPEIVEYITKKIKSFSNPKRVTFEILESEGIENYDEAFTFVKMVKELGCKVAIDDFGSGYSNFEHILNLHVDLLKIDASLIKRIDVDENARLTVQAIVSFASSLNIATCAEFVHSREVYEVLEEMGVTYIQGYYIGKPLPDLVE